MPTQDSYFGVVVASFLLAHVGFWEFVLSHHCLGGGSRVCYFEKRPIPNGDLIGAGVQVLVVRALPLWPRKALRGYIDSTTIAGPKPLMLPPVDWPNRAVDLSKCDKVATAIGGLPFE